MMFATGQLIQQNNNQSYSRTTDTSNVIKKCYSRTIDTTNIIKWCYNKITDTINI